MSNLSAGRPQIGRIISEAIRYMVQTLLFQILFTLIYFSVFFTVLLYFGNRFGLLESYNLALEKLKISSQAYMEELHKISRTDASYKLYWAYTLVLVFLYPLNLGLFKIYRKIDLKQPPTVHDLFAGYSGINFFIYTGFFLFWIMVYNMVFATIFLPAIWVVITLFAAPLMFFSNKKIGECISLSVKAFRKYPGEILICVLFAVAVRYAGIFSIAGALLAFPVWNAVIYALYINIFIEGSDEIV